MKDFIAATLLVAASLNGAAAADSPSQPDSKLLQISDILANAKKHDLGTGDFMDAFACTADLASGTVVDEPSCATAKDSGGAACIWCDASAVVGSGVCVSADIQSIAGQFWDSLCATDDGSGATPANPVPAPPAPIVPNPTPNPTNKPVEPAPVPVPDDNDQIPDALKCSIDASFALITDETACVAQKDASSDAGENCVWCSVRLLGGACVTNSMKASASFLCGGGEKEGKHLRGNDNIKVNGGSWMDSLDPSCLGEGVADLVGGTQEGCDARTDSNGEKCIWCNADVFGICATPSQKGHLGSYMDCADADASPVATVE